MRTLLPGVVRDTPHDSHEARHWHNPHDAMNRNHNQQCANTGGDPRKPFCPSVPHVYHGLADHGAAAHASEDSADEVCRSLRQHLAAAVPRRAFRQHFVDLLQRHQGLRKPNHAQVHGRQYGRRNGVALRAFQFIVHGVIVVGKNEGEKVALQIRHVLHQRCFPAGRPHDGPLQNGHENNRDQRKGIGLKPLGKEIQPESDEREKQHDK
mmetsp:Transcript_13563/g.33338  ORF Transcript_13563/g.33338 Transcript_13563/m.33338 type:complete len:209 (-) Transcript_13563:844-1470(-)